MDAAFDSLQRATELNPDWREQAKTDADFDGIRQDERFLALLGQQGIVSHNGTGDRQDNLWDSGVLRQPGD